MSDRAQHFSSALSRQRTGMVQRSFWHLIAMPNEELARVDPIEMNLLVATGLPALAHLPIRSYQEMADNWASDIQKLIEKHEGQFWNDPARWYSDIHLFRLDVLMHYVDSTLGIRYREDQRNVKKIRYLDPGQSHHNGQLWQSRQAK